MFWSSFGHVSVRCLSALGIDVPIFPAAVQIIVSYFVIYDLKISVHMSSYKSVCVYIYIHRYVYIYIYMCIYIYI